MKDKRNAWSTFELHALQLLKFFYTEWQTITFVCLRIVSRALHLHDAF